MLLLLVCFVGYDERADAWFIGGIERTSLRPLLLLSSRILLFFWDNDDTVPGAITENGLFFYRECPSATPAEVLNCVFLALSKLEL